MADKFHALAGSCRGRLLALPHACRDRRPVDAAHLARRVSARSTIRGVREKPEDRATRAERTPGPARRRGNPFPRAIPTKTDALRVSLNRERARALSRDPLSRALGRQTLRRQEGAPSDPHASQMRSRLPLGPDLLGVWRAGLGARSPSPRKWTEASN